MPCEVLPYVSIVIPVFNEERYLWACLTALMSLNYPKDCHEILLIDNGSTDRSLEIAKGFCEISIHVKKDVKVGAVRNYGTKKAKGDIIVFLDSDCVVNQDWLRRGVCKLKENPNSVFGGQYWLREDPSWLERYWILKRSDQIVVSTTLVGGCIFVPASTFHQVGGFDESLNAGEDTDLTERLKKNDFNVNIDTSLSVIHLGFPSELRPFVKRQIWHSSDYVNELPHSLRDKVFLVTLVFMAGMIGFLASMFFLPVANVTLIASAFLVFFSPAILSAKRIRRAGAKYKGFFDYVSIYLVDWLYLVGRSLGVCLGIKNRLSFRSAAKVGRR